MIILFAILFLAAIAWLWLAAALYRRLSTNHAELCEEMGSPTLLGGAPVSIFGVAVYTAEGNRGSASQLLSFVYGSKVRQLGDPVLLRVCRIMAILFPTFLVAFAVLFFSIVVTSRH